MQQPEQDGTTRTELPELAALKERQEVVGPTGTVVFDTETVSIYYGSFQAVTDVSLTIYEHEITAFIGSSGSGKTTMLRAFNRMNDLVPSSHMDGEIYYRGVSLYAPDVSPIAVRRAYRHGLPEAEPVPEVDL